MPNAARDLIHSNAVERFNKKEITPEQLNQILEANGTRSEAYIKAVERNPRYHEENNQSRTGFTYCCYNHAKGKYFQNTLKPLILKLIDLTRLTFSVSHNPKNGRLFQALLNKIISLVFISVCWTISRLHSKFQDGYDEQIYEVSDARLILIRDFLNEYVDNWFTSSKENKINQRTFMRKIIDIIIGLVKEDIY